MSRVRLRALLGVAALVAAGLCYFIEGVGSQGRRNADAGVDRSALGADTSGVDLASLRGVTAPPRGPAASAVSESDEGNARTEIEPHAEVDEALLVRYTLAGLPVRFPGDMRAAFATLYLGYYGDRGPTIELGRIDHLDASGSFRIDPALVAPRSIEDMIQSGQLMLATRPSAIGNARAIYLDGERPYVGGTALQRGELTQSAGDGAPGELDLGAIEMTPHPLVGTIRLVDPGPYHQLPLRVSTRRMAARAAGIMEIGSSFEGRLVFMERHDTEVKIFAEPGVAAWTVSMTVPEGGLLFTKEAPTGEDILIELE